MVDPRGNDTDTTVTFYDANDNIVKTNIQNNVPVESDGKPNFTTGGNFATQSGRPPFFINRYTYEILDRAVKQDLDATGSNPVSGVNYFFGSCCLN
jgi:hypothetical protein